MLGKLVTRQPIYLFSGSLYRAVGGALARMFHLVFAISRNYLSLFSVSLEYLLSLHALGSTDNFFARHAFPSYFFALFAIPIQLEMSWVGGKTTNSAQHSVDDD